MLLRLHDTAVITARHRATIEGEVAILAQRLRPVGRLPMTLDVRLDREPASGYTVCLTFDLDGEPFVALGEGRRAGTAIRDAFDALADALAPMIVRRTALSAAGAL